jgi:hypothetical protein
MRIMVISAVASTVLLICSYAPAARLTESSTALAALQVKADQAPLRDRCYLYAELVSRMTDLAGRQFNSGDSEEASETLMLVQRYAEKIHMDISEDSKKLKSAELLMQRTTFRLKDMLHEVSYEDQMTVAVTLKQLNQVQAHLMLQVFEK